MDRLLWAWQELKVDGRKVLRHVHQKQVWLLRVVCLRWLQQRSWHDQLREDCIMCSQLIGLGLKMLERGAH
jgi:hypothetical protein